MLRHSLIAMLSRSGEGKETARSLSQAATCLPNMVEASRGPFLMLNVMQGSCEDQFL